MDETEPRGESLAERVAARLPELTDELVRVIGERNPGYRTANVVPAPDLWQSCHDNISRVLELIAEAERSMQAQQPADTDRRYDAARATGRTRAEQRMPLDDVLRSFRLGGRLIWEALIAQAHTDHSAGGEELLAVGTRVWEVVDTTSAQVAAAYHVTESQLRRLDEQRRAALWEGLLRGRAKDLAFAYEVARTLGVPVQGSCAMVVIESTVDSDRTGAALERSLATVRVDSAWQVRSSLLIGLLVLPEPDLGVTLRVLSKSLDLPTGVSLVVPGLAEVDLAYQQASLALRSTPPSQAGVTALDDRLPEAVLLSSPELAERLVQRWLGRLLGLPVAERQVLLDTLRWWVATAGSVSQTAELARCHRNTVLNRLRRVYAVTGHDLADSGPPVELALALRAWWLTEVRTRG
ncbi:MAG TPA: helix-turn-helix domain-containing protein [Pseudonocardiaceae bacterium]|jgi:hypothetical protein|nr:helix-turn-helix domain-containing protein [Pseudonocardiaceae bacterium]